MLAAENGYVDVVRLLSKAGAGALVTDYSGQNALDIAVKNGSSELVAELNQTIKNLKDGKQPASKSPQQVLADNMERAISCDLASAAQFGDSAVIQIQISAGVNVNSVDKLGWTPLMHAACFGQDAAISVLIAPAAASIEATENEDNRTALYLACSFGHLSVTRALIKAGANTNAKDKSERTPMIVAASRGYNEVVDLLIEGGASVDAIDANGWTALAWASFKGHESTASALVRAGASLEAAKINGKTPLMVASNQGHGNIVSILVNAGAKVDAKNEDDKTALHFACEKGNAEIAGLLISVNAKTDAVDKLGWTPLKLAERDGHTKIVQLINNTASAKITKAVHAALPELKQALDRMDTTSFMENLGKILDCMMGLTLASSPANVPQPHVSPKNLPSASIGAVHPILTAALPPTSVTPKDTSSDSSIEVHDELKNFPIHLAIQCSGGDVKLFKMLTSTMKTEMTDPNAKMKVQQSINEDSSETLVTAVEYAFLLGYRDIGTDLAQQMQLEL